MSSHQPDPGSVGTSLQLLANGTRLRIVRTLADAGDDVGIHGLSYAELKEQAGVEDNGRFNYHLGKLVDRFVVKDESEGKYYLRYATHHVYRTFVSGAFDERVTIDRYGIDGTCLYCDAGLEAYYTANQIFYVRCFACDTTFQCAYFPARGVSAWSRRELPAVVDRHHRHFTRLMGRRICPWCGTRLSVTVARAPGGFDLGGTEPDSPSVYVTHVCGACGGYQYNTVGMVVLERVPVAAFLHEQGVHPGDVRTWDLEFAVTGRHTEVRSTDPWRVTTTVSAGDERLRVTVDGNATIVDATRSSG